jgi:hypothetical protein
MSDFFAFEDFEDLVVEGAPVHPAETGGNLSLDSRRFEFLREAVQRLLPGRYERIYDRAYKLFCLCIGNSLTGKRSSYLMAAICIMHAALEVRSDLVILPIDIEIAFSPMQMSQFRFVNIQRNYDLFCERLRLPKLEPQIDKILFRAFKQGCNIASELDVSRLVETGLRFVEDVTNVSEAQPSATSQRVNYAKLIRIETIAAVCGILSARYHGFRNITAKEIETELHVSKGSVQRILSRLRDETPQEVVRSKKPKKRRRTDSVIVGGLVIPSGVSEYRRGTGAAGSKGSEEIVSILNSVGGGAIVASHKFDDDDPLAFLFSEPESVNGPPAHAGNVAPHSTNDVPHPNTTTAPDDPLAFLGSYGDSPSSKPGPNDAPARKSRSASFLSNGESQMDDQVSVVSSLPNSWDD